MKFALTAEQTDLQAMLAAYLLDRSPLSATARDAGSGTPFEPTAWLAMAEDLGLQGVDVPESLGGVGLTAVELSVVLQQAGRVLYPGPLLTSTGLGLSPLLSLDPRGAEADGLLRGAVAGRVVVAAISDDGGTWHAESVTTRAEDAVGAWLLTGVKVDVLQADLADDLVVAARSGDGSISLFVVDPAEADISVESSIDPTRTTCRVALTATPARLVAPDVSAVLHAAGMRADLAIASESLGAATRVLDIAVEHVTHRHQFGRAVGAFQGVKHRLSDVLVDIELATSAVYLAACHLAEGDVSSAQASIPMARSAAADALSGAAAASVQVHGGIGFTWENESHFFVKRGRASRELLGSPASRLDEVWEHGGQLARTS